VAKCSIYTKAQVEVLGSITGCYTSYGESLGGPLCYTHNPILGLLSGTCLQTTNDDDQIRQQHLTQTHNNHHHHGGEAANPWSGMDLMNTCRPRGGQPCTYLF
jgi:hypothetical protein